MPSSYEINPIVELSQWSVYEVPLHGPGAPWTRHFVGYSEEQGLAHVSPAILMFDSEHGVAASASRRVFQLVGDSGRHPEGERMWARWKAFNAVQHERDITSGFFKAMFARQGNAVAAVALRVSESV